MGSRASKVSASSWVRISLKLCQLPNIKDSGDSRIFINQYCKEGKPKSGIAVQVTKVIFRMLRWRHRFPWGTQGILLMVSHRRSQCVQAQEASLEAPFSRKLSGLINLELEFRSISSFSRASSFSSAFALSVAARSITISNMETWASKPPISYRELWLSGQSETLVKPLISAYQEILKCTIRSGFGVQQGLKFKAFKNLVSRNQMQKKGTMYADRQSISIKLTQIKMTICTSNLTNNAHWTVLKASSRATTKR